MEGKFQKYQLFLLLKFTIFAWAEQFFFLLEGKFDTFEIFLPWAIFPSMTKTTFRPVKIDFSSGEDKKKFIKDVLRNYIDVTIYLMQKRLCPLRRLRLI